jgi:hypothetical protein
MPAAANPSLGGAKSAAGALAIDNPARRCYNYVQHKGKQFYI